MCIAEKMPAITSVYEMVGFVPVDEGIIKGDILYTALYLYSEALLELLHDVQFKKNF